MLKQKATNVARQRVRALIFWSAIDEPMTRLRLFNELRVYCTSTLWIYCVVYVTVWPFSIVRYSLLFVI